MSKSISIFDTTLRDGTQGEGVSLSADDKLKIAKKLDELGVSYIEGGIPGSNSKDIEFFKRVGQLGLNAKITAFGSTRRKDSIADQDANLNRIIESGAQAATLVGKSWDFHVHTALQTTLEENLAMIYDSVAYLKRKGLEVIFDAEHFFDGYKNNPQYAVAVLKKAKEAYARIGSSCAIPTAARCRMKSEASLPRSMPACRMRISASTPITTASWPSPIRLAPSRLWRPPGAGHDQRLRRALRQRQPVLDHPESAAQARI